MKKTQLIRLLLTVRNMNTGQFWALLKSLGMSDVLQPPPMDEPEIEEIIKGMEK